MAELIYLLCSGTSLLCAFLLLRSYRHNGMRLLLWSGLCFAGLTINSILVFLDMIVIHDIDLRSVRLCVALASMSVLLFGLIWEAP